MLTDYLGAVEEFHKVFGCVHSKQPHIAIDIVAIGRLRLILEEVSELAIAMDKRDLVEIADALADLLYVTFGTAIAYGLPMDEIFREVHNSNMTKVGGHHEGGKFVKPPTYRPPNIKQFLDKELL